MRTYLVVLGATGGALAAATLAARAAAARIEAAPDPVPLERLRRKPEGDEVVVRRPDGTVLRLVVSGDGPTVVLAHGFALDTREWNLVWDALVERGYRCVTFDQRGHGRSSIGSDGIGSHTMAGDYLAVLEAVDAHDAVLVGHSMGGFLGLTAVLDVPGVAERLRGLVLVATFAGNVFHGGPLNAVPGPLLRSRILPRAATHSHTAGTLLGAFFLGAVPSPAMVRALLEEVLQQDLRPLGTLLEAFRTEGLSGRLGEVGLPTVVLCGRADRAAPPRASERLAAGIPGARAVWLQGKGHMLNWEAPEAVVDAVTSLARAGSSVPAS